MEKYAFDKCLFGVLFTFVAHDNDDRYTLQWYSTPHLNKKSKEVSEKMKKRIKKYKYPLEHMHIYNTMILTRMMFYVKGLYHPYEQIISEIMTNDKTYGDERIMLIKILLFDYHEKNIKTALEIWFNAFTKDDKPFITTELMTLDNDNKCPIPIKYNKSHSRSVQFYLKINKDNNLNNRDLKEKTYTDVERIVVRFKGIVQILCIEYNDINEEPNQKEYTKDVHAISKFAIDDMEGMPYFSIFFRSNDTNYIKCIHSKTKLTDVHIKEMKKHALDTRITDK